MQTKITAIIVDDEESARNVLSNLIKRFSPQIEIIKTCSNVLEAVKAIKTITIKDTTTAVLYLLNTVFSKVLFNTGYT